LLVLTGKSVGGLPAADGCCREGLVVRLN